MLCFNIKNLPKNTYYIVIKNKEAVNMQYGLVLAGGGVRGAYQIGVWQALREMGIEVSSVVGTSIGAINGALFVQGEYEKAAELWKKISIDKVIDLPPAMKFGNNPFGIRNLSGTILEMYKNGGLDISPLENLLRSLINEEKIRLSTVDFGIAAFSLTDKKEIYKFKADIPMGEIVDYIMASVSLIGFKVRTINANKFIDGGMSNNMPVNMLLERGINNIITVDVRGIGFYRNFNLAGKNVISIRSENPQTGMMEFDTKGIQKSIEEGYIGCMRAFGKVEGELYSFWSVSYRRARTMYSDEIISGIEKAAKIFDIDIIRIYTFEELTSLVLDEYYRYSVNNKINNISFAGVKKESDNVFLTWLVHSLECGKSDFISKKMAVFGEKFDAASAILYFKNQN